MKLVELLNIASEGYEDGYLAQYYDEDTGKPHPAADCFKLGDGLAMFIVNEIAECFEEGATDEEQLHAARQLMATAGEEIEHVLHELSKSRR